MANTFRVVRDFNSSSIFDSTRADRRRAEGRCISCAEIALLLPSGASDDHCSSPRCRERAEKKDPLQAEMHHQQNLARLEKKSYRLGIPKDAKKIAFERAQGTFDRALIAWKKATKGELEVMTLRLSAARASLSDAREKYRGQKLEF